MSRLLRRPNTDSSKTHDITPASAGWHYVGFDLYRLSPGEVIAEITGDREVILVLVEGKADLSVGLTNYGELGDRMDVFERKKPHAVYAPSGVDWQAKATTACTLAVCSAPGKGGYPSRLITDIEIEERGRGANTRFIHPIAMEDKDIADSLLVTEVFTPRGTGPPTRPIGMMRMTTRG